jgi:hypothetical protein
MYYIKKFGIDEHLEYKAARSDQLPHPSKFCSSNQPKDVEFIGYKSHLINQKKKG